MKILHIYDGPERVFPGEGSCSFMVYNIAEYVAEKGHDVTILERRWEGLDCSEGIEGDKDNLFKSLSATIPVEQLTSNKVEKIIKTLGNKVFEWNFRMVK